MGADHLWREGKKIELFMPDLRRKQQILKENGVETGEQWLIKLHLAHEFYHFLEFTTLGKVGMRLDPVQKKTIFGTVQRPLTTAARSLHTVLREDI